MLHAPSCQLRGSCSCLGFTGRNMGEINLCLGDVIEVVVHDIQGFGWRDVFSIAGAVAAVALAVERIVSVASNN